MKKIFPVFLLYLLVFDSYSQGLFPEREKIEKQSKLFFKKVDLHAPALTKVDFYVQSGRFLPAYLCLSEYMAKSPFLEKLLLRFKEKNLPFIEEFNRHKISLKTENYHDVIRKSGISRLKFFLLVLFSICDDYSKNILFGSDAYHQWNILLSLTEAAYKAKSSAAESTALLYISATFTFFKRFKKWQKQVKKNLEKIDLKAITDEDVRLVLQHIPDRD